MLQKNESPLEEDEIQFLVKIGLSLPQAKVHLALTRLNKAVTARTISKFSKVARHDVYRILGELHEKGLVERIVATPAEFKSVPIEDCISILIGYKKEEFSQAQEMAARIIQKLRQTDSQSALKEEESRFILVPGKGAYLLKLRAIFENSQTSIDAITTLERFRFIMFIFGDDIKKVLKRGVQFRVITQKAKDESAPLETVKAFEQNPLFQVRYTYTPPQTILSIADKKEVTIAVSAKGGLDASSSLWSNNPNLVE